MRFTGQTRAGGKQDRLRHAYECLRNLLNRNTLLLEQMAELEADLSFHRPDSPFIHRKIMRLADETLLLVEDLNVLTRSRYKALYRTCDRIRGNLADRLREAAPEEGSIPLSVRLDRVPAGRRDLVGGKAYNLARAMEVIREQVPAGFVLTTEAYWEYMYEGGLFPAILPSLQELHAIRDPVLFRERLRNIRRRVRGNTMPPGIEEAILRGASEIEAPYGWAVRSSAVGEDGRLSFAGQFETLLNVRGEGLTEAYRRVLESRFQPRAVVYRRESGLREIDTPMAVLFVPMVAAKSAGVLYTRDPEQDRGDRMLVHAAWGLAPEMVAGRMEADRFVLSREGAPLVLEERIAVKPKAVLPAPKGGLRMEPVDPEEAARASLGREELERIRETGRRLERHFGFPLDIEWVLDPGGKVWVVQVRPLVFQERAAPEVPAGTPPERPLLEGGIPIQPGRAAGPVVLVEGAHLPSSIPQGSILVVPAATPELAVLMPFLAGCISETGNPAGHAAALMREWKVPCLFGVEGALRILQAEQTVGLDATQRRVYRGNPWPELAERREPRRPSRPPPWDEDPLCSGIFPLHLVDPASPRFRAEGCSSLHDIIRFVHEKAVEGFFQLGDSQAGGRRHGAKRLDTEIPLHVMVLDLGGALSEEAARGRSVTPEQIGSRPFQGIWRGIADPRVSWAGRRQVSLKGFTSVLVSSMAGSGSGGRRLGAKNYLLVARDYMNMNLRLAYHYTMVDSLVGKSPENNFVNFRFRGGGARSDRRELRARFLSEVLLRSQFAVDRRGDLVTAWLRRYPAERCEEALTMLGRLMACSRQMDMLISNTGLAHEFAERFLAGDYEVFR